jgi:hypothetical protein
MILICSGLLHRFQESGTVDRFIWAHGGA